MYPLREGTSKGEEDRNVLPKEQACDACGVRCARVEGETQGFSVDVNVGMDNAPGASEWAWAWAWSVLPRWIVRCFLKSGVRVESY